MAFDVDVQELGESVAFRWPPLLRELALLEVAPAQLLSVYLDVCWDEERQRRRTQLEMKDQLRRLQAASPSLERDLGLVEEWVADRVHARGDQNGTRGVALFLCSARGIARAVRSAVRLPNRVLVGQWPSLMPLVTVCERATPVMCMVVDSKGLRAFELSAAGADPMASMLSDVPRGVHPGGWSQLKLQHWHDREVENHFACAAEIIEQWAGAPGPRRVLLGGRTEVLAGVLPHLPPHVRANVWATVALNYQMSDAELEAASQQELERLTREEVEAMLREAIDEAGGGTFPYATGPEAVVEAVNQRRLETLLLDEQLAADATRCPRCGVIGAAGLAHCPACGNDTLPMPLGEALVQAAIRQDANAHLVASPSRLALCGGVLARLRY